MFGDSDRARLADKLFGFTLQPGDTAWYPGPDQNTEFNCLSQGNSGAVTQVRVYASDPQGNALGAVSYATTANRPNVKGPVQGFGSARDVGATGPVSLGFQNMGPDAVIVTIH